MRLGLLVRSGKRCLFFGAQFKESSTALSLMELLRPVTAWKEDKMLGE